MARYVETSAFLKLLVAEPHSPAMHPWFRLTADCCRFERFFHVVGVEPNPGRSSNGPRCGGG